MNSYCLGLSTSWGRLCIFLTKENNSLGFRHLGVDFVYTYLKRIIAWAFNPLESTLYILTKKLMMPLAFSSLDIVYTYQKMNTVSVFRRLGSCNAYLKITGALGLEHIA